MAGKDEMDSLKEIIQVIGRPLDFAERAGSVALKDLGRFISAQVTSALSQQVRPQAIEADLLGLVQLFSDYDELPSIAAGRVEQARGLIARLEQLSPSNALPATRIGSRMPISCKGSGPRGEALAGGIRTWKTPSGNPWRYEDRSR